MILNRAPEQYTVPCDLNTVRFNTTTYMQHSHSFEITNAAVFYLAIIHLRINGVNLIKFYRSEKEIQRTRTN